jgi:quinol monooxygenase YgiN
MYVVVVFFEVGRERVAAFRKAALLDAKCSVERERGCRTFDVSQDPLEPSSFFFYEVYDDKAAFDAHLETQHFAEFNATSEPLVVSKRVLTYELISDAGQA